MSNLYQTAYKYQFDPTGARPTNRIADEDHIVLAGKHHLPFVLLEGVFYSDSVEIKKEDGSFMGPTDYHFIGMEEEVTGITGLSTAGGLVIDDTSYVGNIEVTYQCVGGPEGNSTSMIRSLEQAIRDALANPTINFNQIEGLPATYPPSLHRHHPKDLEDLDLIKQAFDDATNALVNSRPLGTSALNFQEQINRLWRALSYQRNSINDIVSINGSGSRLAAVEALLSKDETIPDYIKGDLVANNPVVVNEWDPNLVHSIAGTYVFKAVSGETERADFAVLSNGTVVLTTTFGELNTVNTDEYFLSPDAAIIGGKLQVSLRSKVNGAVKLKWNNIL